MLGFETKFGGINFSDNVINKIVVKAVEACDGKAELYNYKGKYMKVVPDIASKINLYNEETGSIEMIETEEGLELRAYVVLRFGASIKQVTADIINNIYEGMETMLGKKPEKVTVIVTGIMSKNIARRHIEVSK